MNELQAVPGKVPVVLTIPQCAKVYNLSPYTLRRWVKTGVLNAIRSGKKIFINTDTLNNFLSSGGGLEPVNHNGIRIIKERG